MLTPSHMQTYFDASAADEFENTAEKGDFILR